MDILIITVLQEELDAILHLVPTDCVRRKSLPTYYSGKLASPATDTTYSIAIARLDHPGNVGAALITRQLIDALHPASVLVVGIAGGIKGRVSLGDVIVSSEIWYVESGKITPESLEIRPHAFNADWKLVNCANNVSEVDWVKYVGMTRPDQDLSLHPRFFCGPIAVSEKVHTHPKAVKQLLNTIPKLIGIEMESYGVGEAASHSKHSPGFIAIRGISDYADPNKEDSWHEYASSSAAAFAVAMIEAGGMPKAQPNQNYSGSVEDVFALHHLSLAPVPRSSLEDAFHSEYPYAKLTEIPIDLSDLCPEGSMLDPYEAVQRQNKGLKHLLAELQRRPQAEIAYFGLVHVPLAFYMGNCLSKHRVRHFEFNRTALKWEPLHELGSGPSIIIEGIPDHQINSRGDVIIRASISRPVQPELIGLLVDDPLATISMRLAVDFPKRDVITSHEQIAAYGKAFAEALDQLGSRLPNIRAIHIFYAGPVSLAFQFGQIITRTTEAGVIVYNFSPKDVPAYGWGLTITDNLGDTNFVIDNRRRINDV